MRKFDLELAVGLFVIAGILCIGFLSIKVAKSEIYGGGGYNIYALFSNTGGLKEGASVVIAGVRVGKVKEIRFEDYEAKVILFLPDEIKIQEDAIASIKTRGLIGDKYLEIAPGGSDILVKPGERIRETTPAVDIEELISNFVFGKI